MKVKLIVDKHHHRQYKKLLTSAWSLETVKDSCLLMADFLKSSGLPLSYSTNSAKMNWEKNILPYLHLISSQVNEAQLPMVPDKLPQRKSTTNLYKHHLVSEAAYNLAFPLSIGEVNYPHMKLEGDVDFLKDLKSLIFLLVSNYVLPELTKARMTEERDFLIWVLFLQALITWHDQPAHQNYLFAVLFDKLGWSSLYRWHLQNAFKLTSSEEHDYLTKAQAYWSVLIDEELFSEAEDFVLRLLRNAREEHFEEIKAMVALTFHLQSRRHQV